MNPKPNKLEAILCTLGSKYKLVWAVDGSDVGGGKWEPMTYYQAITARSKFTNPESIRVVEIT